MSISFETSGWMPGKTEWKQGGSRDSGGLLDALERVKKTGVHLVDAYLAACAVESKLPVASFDRDFDRFADVVRFETKA
jgi:predicted nucleic acid-binding protein